MYQSSLTIVSHKRSEIQVLKALLLTVLQREKLTSGKAVVSPLVLLIRCAALCLTVSRTVRMAE